MKAITEYIDAHYLSLYPEYKFWGLAELTDKSKDRFPVTVNGREKVCIDDRYDCVVWHRELSGSRVENEEYSWGLEIASEYRIIIRTIVAYKVVLGEEFKYEFIGNFPEFEIFGYEKLESSFGRIDVDHEKIAKEEEIHTQYNQHRLCWNIFTFENEIQFILCHETSP